MNRPSWIAANGLVALLGCAAAPAQHHETPVWTFVGGSVSRGLAWRDYESFAPEPDPIVFAEKHLGHPITDREYRLRTDGVALAQGFRALGPELGVEVRDLSSIATFRNLEPLTKRQLRLAAKRSRLIIGLDLMFWFGFGDVSGDGDAEPDADQIAARRLALQQRGFALIDEALSDTNLDLVVGDYPLYPEADELILPQSLRPTEATRAELNSRLQAWAAEREHVFVFQASERIDAAARREFEIVIGDNTEKLELAQLTQLDGIHPNRLGVSLVVTELSEFLRDTVPHVRDVLPEPLRFAAVADRLNVGVDDLKFLRGELDTRRDD